MQIIENWSDIEGGVLLIVPSQNITDYCEVHVIIEKVEDVEGFNNLLRSHLGEEIIVNISREVVKRLGIAVGDHLRARVRQAHIRKYFVHPEMITIERNYPNDE